MKALNKDTTLTESSERPMSEMSVLVKLSTNNSYGQSTIALIHEALVHHRAACTREFFDELRAGCFQNAYNYWESVEDINQLIDEMLTKTAEVSIQNFYAREHAANPGGQGSWSKRLPGDKVERYERFLKMVTPESAG